MTQEQKARAYDEALKKAKEIKGKIMYSHLSTESCKAVSEYIDTIIPELAESEDERIIKKLQEYVKNRNWALNGPTQDEVLAWLERQKQSFKQITDSVIWDSGLRTGVELGKRKEQKPVESISQLTVQGKGVYKICPRCKERMVRDDSMVYTSMPPQYRYECPKCGESECDTVMYDNPEMEEQKPVEKHDLVAQLKEHLANTPKEQLEAEWKELEKWNRVGPTVEEYLGGIKPAEWSEEDKEIFDTFMHKLEVCDLLTNKEIMWAKLRLKSLRPQPKREWSKEEERKLQKCIKIVERWEEDYDIAYAPYSGMLKSLRP